MFHKYQPLSLKPRKLTERQFQILKLIREYIDANGIPPTRMEIAKSMGFKSPNAAEEHLRALARKGAIEMMPGASRGIRLPSVPMTGLPLIGQVAAGEPILAEERVEEHIKIDGHVFSPNADYLLRVKGDSMKDAGILDGDLLAVQQSTQAANGQVVVARIGDDVTVKRYQKKQNKVYLMPENDDYEAIVIDLRKEELNIEGIGVGVLRNDYL